jgi:hypothetical protein
MVHEAPEPPPTPFAASTMSGKWALAIIGIGTLLISGLVALLAHLGADAGRATTPPEPPPVVHEGAKP